jgi:hypothetical protein
MRASDLKPLKMPVDGVLEGAPYGGNSKSAWEEERGRLNDLLAILQEQEEEILSLEAGHLRDRALESPEALADIVKRARMLMGQD